MRVGTLMLRRSAAVAAPGQQLYFGESGLSTARSYSFVVPAGITSICILAVGAGYAFDGPGTGVTAGGGGGALSYINALAVTPGESLTVICGTGYRGAAVHESHTYVHRAGTNLVVAEGAIGAQGGRASEGVGDVCRSGGNGGAAGYGTTGGGGGGVAGYANDGGAGGAGATGAGGNGSAGATGAGDAASGGGGGGDASSYRGGGGGGGMYAFVTAGSGVAGGAGSVAGASVAGKGLAGCGGGSGQHGDDGSIGKGGDYGGGAGGGLSLTYAAGAGFVYIIWGAGRSFPSSSAPV
jgi:hypothetical protein